ncbi:putative retrotransposon hot spot protein 4 (RHS4) [Trypanosoma vivax]|nr:putative retrotransposon hot spot protein 4 (RHS4) [Trypanosoma vivax]KAH8615823.1 putative retrotransposon hot spot protein 4 (RHS4) [Trypanosoma vivax]
MFNWLGSALGALRKRLRGDDGAPRWTVNSCVADVLLDGVPPPNEVLLSYFLNIVRHCGPDIDGNVRMDIVIQEPERFILDENTRRLVLSLPECRT